MSSARQVWEFANNFSTTNTVHVLVSATKILYMLIYPLYTPISVELFHNVIICKPDKQCRLYGEPARINRRRLGEELCYKYTWYYNILHILFETLQRFTLAPETF